VTRKTFEARIRELVTGHTTLGRIAEAMLSARATLKAQYEKLHKAVLAMVREDAVCRRLMLPGVGSEPDREVEGGRSAVRADTEEVSVG
jgi:transposase